MLFWRVSLFDNSCIQCAQGMIAALSDEIEKEGDKVVQLNNFVSDMAYKLQ